VPAAIAAITIVGVTAVRAADWDSRGEKNTYVVTALVSDLAGKAKFQDPVLQNSWGVAFSPAGSPFWIADNATGCSTLYDGAGVKQALQVSIPLPGKVGVPGTDCQTVKPPPAPPPTPTPAAPTGIIWNPSAAFVVPGTVSTANPKGIPAIFIFDTEDGTISAWAGGLTPPTNAVIAVDNSKSPNAAHGAVYKGLAFGVNVHGAFLFATNFRAGTIDVFGPPTAPGGSAPGGLFTSATTDGGFTDPQIPAGFAPFGIQNINGDLFVTYAKQNAQRMPMWRVRGTGLLTCSTPTAICCGALPAADPLTRPGASRGHPSPSAGSAARSSLAISATGKSMFSTLADGLSMSSTAQTTNRW
jgi:uncharacterized protein (TIGR03118 family)